MNLIQNLKNFFSAAVRELFQVVKEAFKQLAPIAFVGLKDIVNNAILEVKADPSLIKDEQKRKAAFDKIKAAALAKGKTLKDSVINLLIELTIARLKTKGLL